MDLDLSNVTRFEVIDDKGKRYVNWDNRSDVPLNIKFSMQDDGKTLKVFISDKKDEFELAYCPYCLQMTNHLNNVCQKHNNNV